MKNLIDGAKQVFAWWPVKVVTEELDCIPTKVEWRWLEEVQMVGCEGEPMLYTFYSVDFAAL